VALTGGQNQCRIWEGFAKRGLGFSADQGDPDSRTDGTEAFDMPPSCITLDTIPSPTSESICAGDTATYLVGIGTHFTPPVTLNGSTTAPSATVSFSQNPVTATLPTIVDMEVGNTGSTPFGSYTVGFSGDDGNVSDNASTSLQVYDSIPGAVSLITPADGAVDVPNPPFFEWATSTQALTYALEVDDDPNFNSIDYSVVVEGTSHDIPFSEAMAYGTTYYWKVTAENICGVTTSAVWEFTTEFEPGACDAGFATVLAYETDLEDGVPGWTHSGTNDTWMLSDARTTSGFNAWYAEDLTNLSNQRLVSPEITLPPPNQSPITLQFQNYQAFEQPNADGRCWDAGILEISSNGGSSWSKVPNSAMLTDPYDNIIWNDSPGNNPITIDYGATLAWCDEEQPFLNSVVDLDSYAGQQVQLRWRMGTDSAAGNEGWYLDDVKVQSCALGPVGPDIEVTPDELESTQNQNSQSVETLTVSNVGDAELNWSVENDASGDCTSPGNDVPWLDPSPTSGATGISGSSDVDVTFDSSGLAVDVYTATLCVNSNDSDNPVVSMPVTMTVESIEVFLPYVDAGSTTSLVQASSGASPLLGLIILPALAGILPIWQRRRQ
jgi:hypothetical protein